MLERLAPISVSSFGGEIDSVFRLVLYISVFWFVVVEGLIVIFALRYRRKSGRAAVYVRGEKASQAAWVLVPALIVVFIDFGIDAASHRVWDAVKVSFPPPEVEVGVSAKQFNWEFSYSPAGGKLATDHDKVIENELHVPVGKVVWLRLSSQDVIHSFWLPSFRLKQDVLPGRVITAWFKAQTPGIYEIACSELCGFGHYTMRGTVTVHSAADYERWRRAALHSSTAATAH
jgi:cytochrome c oxidase subunit 2